MEARCRALRSDGFIPDLIVGHTGWGETLFLRSAYPTARVLGYFEWWFGEAPQTGEVTVDPLKNALNLLALQTCDWGFTPTKWQWSRYPAYARKRITVIHEGIDTNALQPDPSTSIELPGGKRLNRDQEVVTFHARCLEPTRGFPDFFRAVPFLQKLRPGCEILILGGDHPLYDPPPAPRVSWREKLQREIKLPDPARVHFLGTIPQHQLHACFRVSSLHVYLTRPFVLSWTPLEAMAMGCAVLASDNPPVREVIRDGRTGFLTKQEEPVKLAEAIAGCLEIRRSQRMEQVRRNARREMVRRFDQNEVCIPAQVRLLRNLACGDRPGTGVA